MTTRIMIMAGGTGGHVFPALAVADELRARGIEVFWLGTRQGLEAELAPKAGIEIEWITISGLRGKGVLGWLLAPLHLSKALFQSLEVIMRRRPMAVLGMGGFASGPGGAMTWVLRKPLVIHEQNAVAGLTNKLLARVAGRVIEAFPGAFPQSRNALAVGNPVRAAIAALPAPDVRMAGREGPLRLLVVGGSLGAKALNETTPAALALLNEQLDESERPEVWHQTGRRNLDDANWHYNKQQVTGRVDAFIDDMAAAYAWADLVLCRSGALTVSELAAAGVASLLVPFPYAVDDHQTANARYLADDNAALLLPQFELDAQRLSEILLRFSRDCKEGRVELRAMANRARAKAMTDAARRVADICEEAARG
jgi:UDP-N-acetylglucosamine--N-acetylmuramyl-(pentapeptide) pyrophosphoryl-undecaprenol N-acetylglucosamine transferase